VNPEDREYMERVRTDATNTLQQWEEFKALGLAVIGTNGKCVTLHAGIGDDALDSLSAMLAKMAEEIAEVEEQPE
jgi:hypothetical protein